VRTVDLDGCVAVGTVRAHIHVTGPRPQIAVVVCGTAIGGDRRSYQVKGLIGDDGVVAGAGQTPRRPRGRLGGPVVPAGHRAAGRARALAVLPGLDDDLTFTEAALDLREAVEELESGAAQPAAARRVGRPR
jgi:hypothetical protein